MNSKFEIKIPQNSFLVYHMKATGKKRNLTLERSWVLTKELLWCVPDRNLIGKCVFLSTWAQDISKNRIKSLHTVCLPVSTSPLPWFTGPRLEIPGTELQLRENHEQVPLSLPSKAQASCWLQQMPVRLSLETSIRQSPTGKILPHN